MLYYCLLKQLLQQINFGSRAFVKGRQSPAKDPDELMHEN